MITNAEFYWITGELKQAKHPTTAHLTLGTKPHRFTNVYSYMQDSYYLAIL